MKTILLSILLVSIQLISIAQQQTEHSVFFELDKSDIPENGKQELATWLGQISDTLQRIEVTGHADFLSSEEYNLSLSEKRADAVMSFIESNSSVKYRMSMVSAKGEKFSRSDGSVAGIPKDRKVEVIAFSSERPEKAEPIPKPSTLISEIIPESESDLLEQAEVGQTIVLKNLNFFPGRHFLIPEALPELERLTKILLRNPTMEIEIQGHICCKLDSIDAMDINTRTYSLSFNRAEYIYDQLVLSGVEESRMKYRGFAGSRPLYNPELTTEHRNKNRRVGIKILKK